MPDLTAIGPEPHQRWQNPLPESEVIRLGRAPRTGWKVPWDVMISREHAEMVWKNGQLEIQCLETARNSISFNGEKARVLVLQAGESFEIGSTRFLISEEAQEPESVLVEHAFSRDDLAHVAFGDSAHQMEIISRLPQLMATTTKDEEFAVQLVRLLLEGIPRADVAAVARFDNLASAESGKPSMMRWDSRQKKDPGRFSPSKRLLYTALTQGKTLLHVWTNEGQEGEQYTLSGNMDWAICTRISGESNKGWCVYVTGEAPLGLVADSLKGDVRFTELLAQFIASFRQVRQLEKTQAGMAQFFSPTVLETLNADVASSLLSPRECDITVIFCDVRGFSKMTEKSGENLFMLLARISEALSVMTKGIVKYDGIIADFQGDAALGFWGWPVALIDGPLPACDAALAIHSGFALAALEPYNALCDFRVGIGIAHGRAIAGMIGSSEQAKVGVFGPPVNLGSRLEGLTKQLGVPILIDEPTAEVVRGQMLPHQGRCRRLARVRPYGIDTPVMVSELLPPENESPVTNQHLRDFDAAVDSFLARDWSKTLGFLARLPPDDGPTVFLKTFMSQHGDQPPADWDGVIPLTRK